MKKLNKSMTKCEIMSLMVNVFQNIADMLRFLLQKKCSLFLCVCECVCHTKRNFNDKQESGPPKEPSKQLRLMISFVLSVLNLKGTRHLSKLSLFCR
jgi:hypothetical protein